MVYHEGWRKSWVLSRGDIIMSEIKDLWTFLESKINPNTTDDTQGQSEEILGCPKLRIGIDGEMKPYVFYEHAVQADRVPDPIDYKYVDIDFNIDLRLPGLPDRTITGLCIRFKKKNDPEYQIVFKEALEGLMETIRSGSLNDDNVISRVEKFAELWNPKENINENELRGLWSELFLIYISKDKKRMLRGWHLNMNDKLDFTFDDGPDFELKSTMAQDRRHWFSHNQLKSRDPKGLVIVSMQLQRLAAGLTLDKLHTELVNMLGKDEKLKQAKERMHAAQIANLELYKTFCFDEALGKNSLKFYPCETIPSVNIDEHPAIKEVRYEIDLSSIQDSKKYLTEIIESDQPTIKK